MSATDDFDFGEPVFRITRAQLIDDGILADIESLYPGLAGRLGVRCHCAMTTTAFVAAVWPVDDTPAGEALEQLGESCEYRLRRVLAAYVHFAIRQRARLRGESTLYFAVTALHAPNDWREIDLKAIVGPSDAGEFVLTLLLPNED